MNEPDKVRKALRELGPGYELVRELGRGTTAVVYLVRDEELDREVAVKVIRSTFTHDEEAVARLRREARLVAKLQHPNIVRVFSTRHFPDGSLALLMEHVPGRDLKEVLRSTGPFEPERALGVLRDVASALAYAHRRRIVHRDVKPENIYLDDEVGTARLADFGIARIWDRDARLTVPGESLGTPAYMSPEQIDGDDVDARTDVYGLGLVGYEMLAGEHPWEGDNLFNVIYKQMNEELPSLRTVRPGLPFELVDVLEGALRKDRDRRWESAEAFLKRLNALRLTDSGTSVGTAGGSVASAGPAGDLPRRSGPGRGPPSPRKASGRGPWRKGRLALGVGALALAALAAWSWGTWAGSGREGWVSLGGAEPTSPPGTAADSRSTDPGADEARTDRSEDGLRVVEAEVPEGGMVGTTVPLVFQLSATDSTRQVRFRVVEGEGVLDRETADAEADGMVRAMLQLPARPGVTTVAAVPEGRGEDEGVRVEVVATPGSPQQVRALVGENQVGDVDSPLPQAVGVRVVDRLGNPIPDTEVRFQVLVGNGSVAPGRARTDTLGRAFARWSLGPVPGDQRAAALVPSAEEATVVFEATARGLAPGTETEPATALPTDEDRARDPVDPSLRSSAEDMPTVGGPATGPVRVVGRALAVGGTHVCVIRARGVPRCRGALAPDGGSGAPLAALASGVRHVCGLDATGEAFCWGANNAGQLGDGTRTESDAPTVVRTATRFSRLALGLGHTCGLDGSGRIHCWGRNVNGQLGDGSRDDRATPRPAAGSNEMVDVVAGWNHTCALGADGRARCWGLNADGQLGDGTRVDRLTPTPVAGGGTFSVLAAGSAHTCGLGGGVVRCWGADGSGQLGVGGTAGVGEPVRLESLPETAIDLVAGAVHTCALLDGGDVWCWGQNVHGQLGDGSTTNRPLPVPVSGDLRFRTLAAGGGSTCGITDDGDRYCWGLNQGGQLGDGTRTNRATPTRAGG